MNREQKRKLGLVAVLGIALLIGGTFAFTAFNQQAINDRLRDNEVEVGGRVHDYYNRDTENKDVFVENYGQEPIMARIRLSEFMEIQERGQTGFTPVVSGTSRDNIDSWTTWLPSTTNLAVRQGPSAAFNQYSNLTFGWERSGQTAPWYMPTFNLDYADLSTAAAGHARDYIAGAGATDGTTDGATHPGDGTDGYWQAVQSFDNSTGIWPGSQVTRETAQNLQEERPPMTIEQWDVLDNEEKIGDFWVIDHTTGWAYWASLLQVGETSSYLLDAAQMTAQADAINGSYYYGIHVQGDLISPDRKEEFLNDGEDHDARLEILLEGIQNNAIDDDTNNGGGLPAYNPAYNEASPVSAFNFGIMNPGRIFTTSDGQQFRYLEDMGNGNHLIIRNDAIRSTSWNAQEARLGTWFDSEIPADLRDIVQPVANSFTTGQVTDAGAGLDGDRWLANNLTGDVALDRTVVVPGGSSRAFALSLADVDHLSRTGAFPNRAQRGSVGLGWWWLRTPSTGSTAWSVGTAGNLGGGAGRTHSNTGGGVRPALILHQ